MISITLLIYAVSVVGFFIFSALLTQVVNKHCRKDNPMKKLIKIYWVGTLIILGVTLILGLTMGWS